MPARKSRQTDVLIVGSGAVGVAAGLEAQEAGAQVVVIEKEAHLGGDAAISGGGCSCVGTRLQREQGIEDSPDLAFDDWIRWGEGAADEAWARFYIEHSNADLYQWGIERGVQWDGLTQQEGNSVPRWHRPAGGGGGLWHALYKHALAQGLTNWITCMAAHDLIVENGRVAGVVTVHQETGVEQDFLASAVILGTGGFASNLDMVYTYRPDLRQHRQVLDKHYEPIPGLYAAGEFTGMAGGHINGKAGLEGTMLGPALFSGRVAGAWAAYEAGYGKRFAGLADCR